jgi:hypothetical protein
MVFPVKTMVFTIKIPLKTMVFTIKQWKYRGFPVKNTLNQSNGMAEEEFLDSFSIVDSLEDPEQLPEDEVPTV